MNTRKIIIIADSIRSAHNVGALLRTADGLAITKVLLCGITPYPLHNKDARLPHLAKKINSRIKKTSLGAEQSQPWDYVTDTAKAIKIVREEGYQVLALEQHPSSVVLTTLRDCGNIALVIGNEVDGIDESSIQQCDIIAEIPMLGNKESFNVVEAATMAAFYFRHLG